MDDLISEEAYVKKIEELRRKMISASTKYGMNDPLVLKYSQELDRVHNYLLTLKILSKRSNS